MTTPVSTAVDDDIKRHVNDVLLLLDDGDPFGASQNQDGPEWADIRDRLNGYKAANKLNSMTFGRILRQLGEQYNWVKLYYFGKRTGGDNPLPNTQPILGTPNAVPPLPPLFATQPVTGSATPAGERRVPLPKAIGKAAEQQRDRAATIVPRRTIPAKVGAITSSSAAATKQSDEQDAMAIDVVDATPMASISQAGDNATSESDDHGQDEEEWEDTAEPARPWRGTRGRAKSNRGGKKKVESSPSTRKQKGKGKGKERERGRTTSRAKSTEATADVKETAQMFPSIPAGPVRRAEVIQPVYFTPTPPPPGLAGQYAPSALPRDMCFHCAMNSQLCFRLLKGGEVQTVSQNAPCQACKARGRTCYPITGIRGVVAGEYPYSDGVHPQLSNVLYTPARNPTEEIEMLKHIVLHAMRRLAAMELKSARSRAFEGIIGALIHRIALLEGDSPPGTSDDFSGYRPLGDVSNEDLILFAEMVQQHKHPLRQILDDFERRIAEFEGAPPPAADPPQASSSLQATPKATNPEGSKSSAAAAVAAALNTSGAVDDNSNSQPMDTEGH